MTVNFNDWTKELLSMDEIKNHKQTLDEIEMAFLESDQANCRLNRIKTLWLLRHFKKIL